MVETCPKCGGVAVLVDAREQFADISDPSVPGGHVKICEKVEEFRCQEQGCEHEFEKVVREPTA